MSLTDAQKTTLLHLARASIEHGVKTGTPLKIRVTDYPAELTENRATFVTLENQHGLRGCVGMLEAVRPLAEDVAENAFAAAFRDRRFPPLAADELQGLQLHISILSPNQEIHCHSEQDLLAQLRPNIDGLILQEGLHRATFLPVVWESLPEPAQFLQQLKLKAGLSAGYWSDSIKAYRYTAELIG